MATFWEMLWPGPLEGADPAGGRLFPALPCPALLRETLTAENLHIFEALKPWPSRTTNRTTCLPGAKLSVRKARPFEAM